MAEISLSKSVKEQLFFSFLYYTMKCVLMCLILCITHLPTRHVAPSIIPSTTKSKISQTFIILVRLRLLRNAYNVVENAAVWAKDLLRFDLIILLSLSWRQIAGYQLFVWRHWFALFNAAACAVAAAGAVVAAPTNSNKSD